jgi:hypothetical protein
MQRARQWRWSEGNAQRQPIINQPRTWLSKTDTARLPGTGDTSSGGNVPDSAFRDRSKNVSTRIEAVRQLGMVPLNEFRLCARRNDTCASQLRLRMCTTDKAHTKCAPGRCA